MLWGSVFVIIFFFKQKTAYEMRISDWSSDVCSSDLRMLALTVQSMGPQRTQKTQMDAKNLRGRYQRYRSPGGQKPGQSARPSTRFRDALNKARKSVV